MPSPADNDKQLCHAHLMCTLSLELQQATSCHMRDSLCTESDVHRRCIIATKALTSQIPQGLEHGHSELGCHMQCLVLAHPDIVCMIPQEVPMTLDDTLTHCLSDCMIDQCRAEEASILIDSCKLAFPFQQGTHVVSVSAADSMLTLLLVICCRGQVSPSVSVDKACNLSIVFDKVLIVHLLLSSLYSNEAALDQPPGLHSMIHL